MSPWPPTRARPARTRSVPLTREARIPYRDGRPRTRPETRPTLQTATATAPPAAERGRGRARRTDRPGPRGAPPVEPEGRPTGEEPRPPPPRAHRTRARPRTPDAPPGPAARAAPPPDTPPAEPPRSRSSRTGRHVRGEPLSHRPADLGVQLPHARQVLPHGQPEIVRHRGQVEPREPPGQPGRGRRQEPRRRSRHPLPHDQRPREDVTEPPSPRRHQRSDTGHDTERHQDLDHPDQTPHQRVPEPDRPPSSRTTRRPHAILPSDRP